MFDTKINNQKPHFNNQNNSKMVMSSYFDYNFGGVGNKGIVVSNGGPNGKMPFIRDYKLKQRDKYTPAYNNPPPLATQQAIAMMEYEMSNNLIISNANNGHFNMKPRIVHAIDKKRYFMKKQSFFFKVLLTRIESFH